jgi:hypothetical protein
MRFAAFPCKQAAKKARQLHAPFSLGMHQCIDASVTDKNQSDTSFHFPSTICTMTRAR